MKKVVTAIVVLVLCVSSFVGGYIAKRPAKAKETNIPPEYSLLAKRLFIENPNDVLINFTKLRALYTDYFNQQKINGSLYFEYLPTGTSVRVQGDEELVAASLMKIPVVMELYRAAELGRINIDQKVKIKEEWLDKNFGTLWQKGAGYEITLREAAKIALKDSDNTAVSTILNTNLNNLSLEENVINSLDIDFARDEKLVLSISARSYSSFLKCLYFSCYLNKQDSQEMLTYLTESTFDNRLRAPIPKTTQIAHKIGTYSNKTQSDCGIIYEPNRNYILCVMLYVPDDAVGNSHIAKLSEITYNYIKTTE